MQHFITNRLIMALLALLLVQSRQAHAMNDAFFKTATKVTVGCLVIMTTTLSGAVAFLVWDSYKDSKIHRELYSIQIERDKIRLEFERERVQQEVEKNRLQLERDRWRSDRERLLVDQQAMSDYELLKYRYATTNPLEKMTFKDKVLKRLGLGDALKAYRFEQVAKDQNKLASIIILLPQQQQQEAKELWQKIERYKEGMFEKMTTEESVASLGCNEV